MKYRDLTAGEILQSGDEHFLGGEWTPISGAIGFSYKPGHHLPIRRPLKKTKDNWIAFADRKPTRSDATNGSGHVMVCDGAGSPVRSVRYDDNIYGYKYWLALNFVPREPVRIKVDGHEVVPQKNGDLKVGCQTVSSKDFEEIVRQRAEAMKQ